MCGAGIHKEVKPFYHDALLAEQCWQSKPNDPYMATCANCGQNWTEHNGGMCPGREAPDPDGVLIETKDEYDIRKNKLVNDSATNQSGKEL